MRVSRCIRDPRIPTRRGSGPLAQLTGIQRATRTISWTRRITVARVQRDIHRMSRCRTPGGVLIPVDIKIKKATRLSGLFDFGVPTGIRTPVTAVKGRCPRPLDDGDEASTANCLIQRRERLRAPNRLEGFIGVHRRLFCPALNGFVGGGNRDRTGDLLHAMQALSQLSYTPTSERALYVAPAPAVKKTVIC